MNFTPFIARPIRYAGITDVAGYRLKRYVILYGGGPLRETEFEPGMKLAQESLPRPAIDTQRPGVGFAIAHQGNGVDYLILRFRHPSGPEHAKVLEAIELFGREVIPRFS